MKVFKSVLFITLTVILLLALSACDRDILQNAVDDINADESLKEELSGLYKIHASKRGSSTIVYTFSAEREELATAEVSKAVAEGGSNEFRNALNEMQKARISDPQIILEFFDLDGILIYTHIFD